MISSGFLNLTLQGHSCQASPGGSPVAVSLVGRHFGQRDRESHLHQGRHNRKGFIKMPQQI